jgi:hypothetical protein
MKTQMNRRGFLSDTARPFLRALDASQGRPFISFDQVGSKVWLSGYRGSSVRFFREDQIKSIISHCFDRLKLCYGEPVSDLVARFVGDEGSDVNVIRNQFTTAAVRGPKMNPGGILFWSDVGTVTEPIDPALVLAVVERVEQRRELWLLSNLPLHPELRIQFNVPANLKRSVRKWFHVQRELYGLIEACKWFCGSDDGKWVVKGSPVGAKPLT